MLGVRDEAALEGGKLCRLGDVARPEKQPTARGRATPLRFDQLVARRAST